MISRIYLALQKHKWVKLEFDPKFFILKKNPEKVKEQRKTCNQEI